MRRLLPLLCLAACAVDAPRAERPRHAPAAARTAAAPTAPPTGAASVEPVPTARASPSAPAAPSSGSLVDWGGPSLAERTALFLELGARAPQAWGEELPGIERSVAGAGPRLALTFDACDAGGYDAELVAWLRSEGVPATLFVSGRFARRHPDVVALLAEEPLFELANHGYDHRPCAVRGERAFGIPGSRSLAEAAAEIERASDLLRSLGARQPRFYRAGTAHYDDVCLGLARGLGYRIAGFRVAGDLGAGLSRAGVRQALEGAPDGAIVLLHMNRPEGQTFEGLRDALPALRARGVALVRLGQGPPPAP